VIVQLLVLYRKLLLTSLVFVVTAGLDSQGAEQRFITIASTTSMEQSGLLGYILPIFTRRTGIDVYVAAVGTGEALKSGQLGQCDVLLVHDRVRELPFMENGFGSVRREVMYNDFVLVGPREDPAGINVSRDVVAAFRKIAEAKALFISRGDASGTDAAEQRLWAEAGGRPTGRRDPWYMQTGSTMQQTLAVAASMKGYVLTDRATWLRFNDARSLMIIAAGDRRLRNEYAVILVNPALHPTIKAELGMAFVEWLTSPDGQAAIASYKVAGEQVFFPNYNPM
jgi:tungstate transport system substrate-binding protein